MAASFRQIDNATFSTAQASLAVTFGVGIAAGSIIVAVGSFTNGATGVTVTDNNSDTVTDSGLGVLNDASLSKRLFCVAFLSPTTGTTAVTATYAGSNPTAGNLIIYEVTGLTSPVFDKVVHASATSASPDSGPTGTLSSNDEAAICFGICTSGFNAQGSGWTSGQGTLTTGNAGDSVSDLTNAASAHQIIAATTSINGTAGVGGSMAWHMLCATVMTGGSGSTDLMPQIWV
jgi:hypothetical protein